MSIQTVEIALPTGIDSVSVGLAEPISIVEVRQGAGGEPGAAGPAGATGPAGPNTLTTATTTNLDGFISGNGTNIAGATAAATAATANTLVLRDGSGGASLEYPTFGSGFQITETGGSDTFGMRSATGDTWSMYGPDYGDFMSFSKAGVINFSPSGFTYGAGAASAHRTALGLGTGDSPTFAGATFATGSIATSQPLTLTQTWTNAAVTYTGLQVNVTDSGPSNAASLLMDLRVGGSSKLSIRKDGRIFGDGANPFINLSTAVGTQIGYGNAVINNGGNSFTFTVSGTELFRVNNNSVCAISNTGSFAWSSASASSGTLDLLLVRDAAGTLAQRNGNAAQESRIYGTYTGPGNYRRLALKMDTAGVAQIVAEGGGAGAAGNVLQLPSNTTFADAQATRTALGLGTGDSPTFAITNASTGFYGTDARLVTTSGGVMLLGSSFYFTWGVSSPTSTKDTSLSRLSAGVLGVGTGTVGSTAGSLSLTNLTASGTIQTGGYTFATLPTPTTGMRAYITDGAALPLYMANAAGGGSTVTPVFYNGTNWINA